MTKECPNAAIASSLSAAIIALFCIAPTAAANPGPDDSVCPLCSIKNGKAHVGLTRDQTANLPPEGPAKYQENKRTVTKVVPYRYTSMPACPGNSNPDDVEVWCEKSQNACKPVKGAAGPLSQIFYQPLVDGKPVGNWTNTKKLTCWTDAIPGAKSEPKLTVAKIQAAFAEISFVKPKATMEPVGNRTLVNLPNYFTADFSGPGYGPGEVRTVMLLGHKVQIKPVLQSNTFHFGDGSSLGPTESRGGGYPDGDVKHAYLKRGTVSASITTVYGGQFAVDGGKFTDLPGTATITGPAQPIQVLEAKGRLVR